MSGSVGFIYDKDYIKKEHTEDHETLSQASNSLSSFDPDVIHNADFDVASNVCSFCFLSGQSWLGQGSLIQYSRSSFDFDVFKIDLKYDEESLDNLIAKRTLVDPNIAQKPSNNIIVGKKQKYGKGRKKSNVSQDACGIDELKTVGFPIFTEIYTLFDSSGSTWVHEFCLLWATEKIFHPIDHNLMVDKLVITSMTRKCFVCENYGANIKCGIGQCTKYMHFPCATSRCIIINIPPNSIVLCGIMHNLQSFEGAIPVCKYCHESLAQCDMMDMLTCISCGLFCHTACHRISHKKNYQVKAMSGFTAQIAEPLKANFRAGWQCHDCKICQICRIKSEQNKMAVCDDCDKTVHTACLKPPLFSVPKAGWKCKNCRICIDCGSRTPGAGASSRWHTNYTLCDSCYQQRNKSHKCLVCKRVVSLAAININSNNHHNMDNSCEGPLKQHGSNSNQIGCHNAWQIIQCIQCTKYVHTACDTSLPIIPPVDETELSTLIAEYKCPLCLDPSSLHTASSHVALRGENGLTIGHTGPGRPPGPKKSTTTLHNSNIGPIPPLKLKLKHVDNNQYAVVVTTLNNTQTALYNTNNVSSKNIMTSDSFFVPTLDGERNMQDTLSNTTNIDDKIVESESMSDEMDPHTSPICFDPPSIEDDDEEPSHIPIFISTNDLYMYYKEICASCGSIGIGSDSTLIFCFQCGQGYHPFCVSVEMNDKMRVRGWRCFKCIICECCGRADDESRLILCDSCDLAYHIYCLKPSLSTIPKGAWNCYKCISCRICSSTMPGINCVWQKASNLTFTKDEQEKDVSSNTALQKIEPLNSENSNTNTQMSDWVCGPCLSRDICPICRKRYSTSSNITNEIIMECSKCFRWVHGACENIRDEWDAGYAIEKGFICTPCKKFEQSRRIKTFKHASLNGTRPGHLRKQHSKTTANAYKLKNVNPIMAEVQCIDVVTKPSHESTNLTTLSNIDAKMDTSEENLNNTNGHITQTIISSNQFQNTNDTKETLTQQVESEAVPKYIFSQTIDVNTTFKTEFHAEELMDTTTCIATEKTDESTHQNAIEAFPFTLAHTNNQDVYVGETDTTTAFFSTKDEIQSSFNTIKKVVEDVLASLLDQVENSLVKIPSQKQFIFDFPPFPETEQPPFQHNLQNLDFNHATHQQESQAMMTGPEGVSLSTITLLNCSTTHSNSNKDKDSPHIRGPSNKIGSGIGGFFVKPRKSLPSSTSNNSTAILHESGVGLINGGETTEDSQNLAGHNAINSGMMEGGGGLRHGEQMDVIISDKSKRKRLPKKRGYIGENYPFYLQELFFGDLALKNDAFERIYNSFKSKYASTELIGLNNLDALEHFFLATTFQTSHNSTLMNNVNSNTSEEIYTDNTLTSLLPKCDSAIKSLSSSSYAVNCLQNLFYLPQSSVTYNKPSFSHGLSNKLAKTTLGPSQLSIKKSLKMDMLMKLSILDMLNYGKKSNQTSLLSAISCFHTNDNIDNMDNTEEDNMKFGMATQLMTILDGEELDGYNTEYLEPITQILKAVLDNYKPLKGIKRQKEKLKLKPFIGDINHPWINSSTKFLVRMCEKYLQKFWIPVTATSTNSLSFKIENNTQTQTQKMFVYIPLSMKQQCMDNSINANNTPNISTGLNNQKLSNVNNQRNFGILPYYSTNNVMRAIISNMSNALTSSKMVVVSSSISPACENLNYQSHAKDEYSQNLMRPNYLALSTSTKGILVNDPQGRHFNKNHLAINKNEMAPTFIKKEFNQIPTSYGYSSNTNMNHMQQPSPHKQSPNFINTKGLGSQFGRDHVPAVNNNNNQHVLNLITNSLAHALHTQQNKTCMYSTPHLIKQEPAGNSIRSPNCQTSMANKNYQPLKKENDLYNQRTPSNYSHETTSCITKEGSIDSPSQNANNFQQTQRNLERWKKDEALGTLATISPVLYANLKYPELQTEYPDMLERSKQMAKIWRNMPAEERIPYLQKARENRATLRLQKSSKQSNVTTVSETQNTNSSTQASNTTTKSPFTAITTNETHVMKKDGSLISSQQPKSIFDLKMDDFSDTRSHLALNQSITSGTPIKEVQSANDLSNALNKPIIGENFLPSTSFTSMNLPISYNNSNVNINEQNSTFNLQQQQANFQQDTTYLDNRTLNTEFNNGQQINNNVYIQKSNETFIMDPFYPNNPSVGNAPTPQEQQQIHPSSQLLDDIISDLSSIEETKGLFKDMSAGGLGSLLDPSGPSLGTLPAGNNGNVEGQSANYQIPADTDALITALYYSVHQQNGPATPAVVGGGAPFSSQQSMNGGGPIFSTPNMILHTAANNNINEMTNNNNNNNYGNMMVYNQHHQQQRIFFNQSSQHNSPCKPLTPAPTNYNNMIIQNQNTNTNLNGNNNIVNANINPTLPPNFYVDNVNSAKEALIIQQQSQYVQTIGVELNKAVPNQHQFTPSNLMTNNDQLRIDINNPNYNKAITSSYNEDNYGMQPPAQKTNLTPSFNPDMEQSDVNLTQEMIATSNYSKDVNEDPIAYKKWLISRDKALQTALSMLAADISKMRKRKKSLASKQRQIKKTALGNISTNINSITSPAPNILYSTTSMTTNASPLLNSLIQNTMSHITSPPSAIKNYGQPIASPYPNQPLKYDPASGCFDPRTPCFTSNQMLSGKDGSFENPNSTNTTQMYDGTMIAPSPAYNASASETSDTNMNVSSLYADPTPPTQQSNISGLSGTPPVVVTTTTASTNTCWLPPHEAKELSILSTDIAALQKRIETLRKELKQHRTLMNDLQISPTTSNIISSNSTIQGVNVTFAANSNLPLSVSNISSTVFMHTHNMMINQYNNTTSTVMLNNTNGITSSSLLITHHGTQINYGNIMPTNAYMNQMIDFNINNPGNSTNRNIRPNVGGDNNIAMILETSLQHQTLASNFINSNTLSEGKSANMNTFISLNNTNNTNFIHHQQHQQFNQTQIYMAANNYNDITSSNANNAQISNSNHNVNHKSVLYNNLFNSAPMDMGNYLLMKSNYQHQQQSNSFISIPNNTAYMTTNINSMIQIYSTQGVVMTYAPGMQLKSQGFQGGPIAMYGNDDQLHLQNNYNSNLQNYPAQPTVAFMSCSNQQLNYNNQPTMQNSKMQQSRINIQHNEQNLHLYKAYGSFNSDNINTNNESGAVQDYKNQNQDSQIMPVLKSINQPGYRYTKSMQNSFESNNYIQQQQNSMQDGYGMLSSESYNKNIGYHATQYGTSTLQLSQTCSSQYMFSHPYNALGSTINRQTTLPYVSETTFGGNYMNRNIMNNVNNIPPNIYGQKHYSQYDTNYNQFSIPNNPNNNLNASYYGSIMMMKQPSNSGGQRPPPYVANNNVQQQLQNNMMYYGVNVVTQGAVYNNNQLGPYAASNNSNRGGGVCTLQQSVGQKHFSSNYTNNSKNENIMANYLPTGTMMPQYNQGVQFQTQSSHHYHNQQQNYYYAANNQQHHQQNIMNASSSHIVQPDVNYNVNNVGNNSYMLASNNDIQNAGGLSGHGGAWWWEDVFTMHQYSNTNNGLASNNTTHVNNNNNGTAATSKLPAPSFLCFGLGNVDKNLTVMDRRLGHLKLAILPDYYGDFPFGQFTVPGMLLLNNALIIKNLKNFDLNQDAVKAKIEELKKLVPYLFKHSSYENSINQSFSQVSTAITKSQTYQKCKKSEKQEVMSNKKQSLSTNSQTYHFNDMDVFDKEIAAITNDKNFLKNFDLSPDTYRSPSVSSKKTHSVPSVNSVKESVRGDDFFITPFLHQDQNVIEESIFNNLLASVSPLDENLSSAKGSKPETPIDLDSTLQVKPISSPVLSQICKQQIKSDSLDESHSVKETAVTKTIETEASSPFIPLIMTTVSKISHQAENFNLTQTESFNTTLNNITIQSSCFTSVQITTPIESCQNMEPCTENCNIQKVLDNQNIQDLIPVQSSPLVPSPIDDLGFDEIEGPDGENVDKPEDEITVTLTIDTDTLAQMNPQDIMNRLSKLLGLAKPITRFTLERANSPPRLIQNEVNQLEYEELSYGISDEDDDYNDTNDNVNAKEKLKDNKDSTKKGHGLGPRECNANIINSNAEGDVDSAKTVNEIRSCSHCSRVIVTPSERYGGFLAIKQQLNNPIQSQASFCGNMCALKYQISQSVNNPSKRNIKNGDNYPYTLDQIDTRYYTTSYEKSIDITKSTICNDVSTTKIFDTNASNSNGLLKKTTSHLLTLKWEFRVWRNQKYKVWTNGGKECLWPIYTTRDETIFSASYTYHIQSHTEFIKTVPDMGGEYAFELIDRRICSLCSRLGDGDPNNVSRLLNVDIDQWVHLNCALWSNHVYETVGGALMNVHLALCEAIQTLCNYCNKMGASCLCNADDCEKCYHFPCAIDANCTFYADKTILCPDHTKTPLKVNDGSDEDAEDSEPITMFACNRRVYIDRELSLVISKVLQDVSGDVTMRIGTLVYVSIGYWLPEHILNFHNLDYIYPANYKVIRYFWDYEETKKTFDSNTHEKNDSKIILKRRAYECSVNEKRPMLLDQSIPNYEPEFRVQPLDLFWDELGAKVIHKPVSEFSTTVYYGKTPKESWCDMLNCITRSRKLCDTYRFTRYFIERQNNKSVSNIEDASNILANKVTTFKYFQSLVMSDALVRLINRAVRGEDLFGLTEAPIIRALESLPLLEVAANNRMAYPSPIRYRFKYGRAQICSMGPMLNPTGSARSEPSLKTYFRRPYIMMDIPREPAPLTLNFQSSGGVGALMNDDNLFLSPSQPLNNNNGGGSLIPFVNNTNAANSNNFLTNSTNMMSCSTNNFYKEPISGNFFSSPSQTSQVSSSNNNSSNNNKTAQYRRMKSECKRNVILGRSRIQGLGLFASRDFDRDQMIIEYVGEMIRSELANVREMRYGTHSTYFFRLDDTWVLDAAASGGVARYINHSCDPNCRAQTITIFVNPNTSNDVTSIVNTNANTDATNKTTKKIVIVANRKIQRGEELCYDYKFDYEGENSKIPCMCGAQNCKKWMN